MIDEPVHGFIDGVGGLLHDAVVQRLALHARVILLGFIAAYNEATPPVYGSALPILFKRALVSGFLLADHAADFGRARTTLAAMLDAGTLRAVETFHHGLAGTPAAFAGLFGEPPPGKQIVRLEPTGA
jgi:NADPH:quinone reductase